ncbi:hypothetical protein B5G33_03570 [Blautia sp. An81]|nr:hypothetical protein B5G33_03570 [Blautia sp. An81]
MLFSSDLSFLHIQYRRYIKCIITQNIQEIYKKNVWKKVDIRDISIIIVVPDQEIEYDHLRTDSRSCESRRCRVRPVIVKDNRAHFLYVYART